MVSDTHKSMATKPVQTPITGDRFTGDRWVKILAQSGTIRAVGINATNTIREAIRLHGLEQPVATYLGEALLAGLLMSSRVKSGGQVSISIKGDSAVSQAVIDALPEGTVRGYVVGSSGVAATELHRTDPEGRPLGPWGEGLISVARRVAEERNAYVGTSQMLTGYLAKDLTFYFHQSEQIPASVGIAVNVDSSGQVKEAGAFLIEVLPGAGSQEIAMIERNISDMHSLAEEIARNPTPTVFLTSLFSHTAFNILEERAISFRCSCSRERVLRAFMLLSPDDLTAIMAGDSGAETKCEFCATTYKITNAEMQDLITENDKKS